MKKHINFKNYKHFSFLILLFFSVCVHPVLMFLFLGFPIFNIGMFLKKQRYTIISFFGKVISLLGFVIFSLPLVMTASASIIFILIFMVGMILTPLSLIFEGIKTGITLILGLFMFYILAKAFLQEMSGFVNCKLCGAEFPHPKRIDGELSGGTSFTCSDCK